MDVFAIALDAGRGFLCDAAIAAAHELGVFVALREPKSLARLAAELAVAPGVHRLRALLDVLVAVGAITRVGEQLQASSVPGAPAIPRAGWGLLAEVIRANTPLPAEAGELGLRYHEHLARAGAPAARELAPLLAGGSLLDIGGGAGAYTAAFLDRHPAATATLVDHPPVVALARAALAHHGDRVRFVAGDARHAAIGHGHDTVLLANVLHLHGADVCAELCALAARAAAPGGTVVIKDLRVDDGRSGPIEGLLFALNMALYTDAGDVYETAQLRAWLERAGLVDIREHRQAAAPEGIVATGTVSTYSTNVAQAGEIMTAKGDGLH